MDKVIELNEHNVRPLIGKVLVRRIVETKTKGGLELPDVSKDMPRPDGTLPKRGTVIRLGLARKLVPFDDGEASDVSMEGETLVPFQVAVGDVVVFNKYGGRPFCEDPDLLLIAEEEILAVETLEPTTL